MIKSFKDNETATVFRGQFSRKLPQDIPTGSQRVSSNNSMPPRFSIPYGYRLATGSKR
jgi:hypothetical protein